MALIGAIGYATGSVDLNTSVVITIEDFGFTEQQIKDADVLHLTCFGNDVLFLYSGENPVSGSLFGHLLYENGNLLVKPRQNIRNFRATAVTGAASLVATLGTFGIPPSSG
jgi:hypothetical protein